MWVGTLTWKPRWASADDNETTVQVTTQNRNLYKTRKKLSNSFLYFNIFL